MSKVAWIIFSTIVVLVLGGLVIYSRISNPAPDVSNVDPSVVLSASDSNGNIADHVKGSADAKVVIVEYGDFQCPSCGSVYPYIELVTEKYGDKIAFIFRNFPLTTIHPNARAAAATAEAAGLQGKFWEMYDALFSNQNSWSSLGADTRTSTFATYASNIGLDMEKYDATLADSATQINKKINFDLELGKKLGVSGTPTFYINGNKISEEVGSDLMSGDVTSFTSLIDEELKKAGVDLPE